MRDTEYSDQYLHFKYYTAILFLVVLMRAVYFAIHEHITTYPFEEEWSYIRRLMVHPTGSMVFVFFLYYFNFKIWYRFVGGYAGSVICHMIQNQFWKVRVFLARNDVPNPDTWAMRLNCLYIHTLLIIMAILFFLKIRKATDEKAIAPDN